MRLLVLVLGALLALTLWGAAANWSRVNWHMSIHGWIAMFLGVVLTLAVGGGLMALSFYSARHGYDDNLARKDDGAAKAESEEHEQDETGENR